MPTEHTITNAELLGYIDELLPADRASEIERMLRDSEDLRLQAGSLLRDRDEGNHTLADIWRRHRVSCPGRRRLGEFLLGTLDINETRAVTLHIDDLGCRFCQADLDDLKAARNDIDSGPRRQRFFESSVGGRESQIDLD